MFVAGMMEWEKFPAGISLGMNFGMLAALAGTIVGGYCVHQHNSFASRARAAQCD